MKQKDDQMKRYLAFSHLDYYPGSASADFVGDFGTVEAALEAAVAALGDFCCILDIETGEWVR